MQIYQITNLVNGKYYIGQTSQSLTDRFKGHIRDSKNKRTRGCPVLHAAIRKYGEENFVVESLCLASDTKELNNLEKLWIVSLDSTNKDVGYNILFGGEGTRGFKWSKESRAKLSASKIGNKANVGRVLSEETKKKISESLMGHPQAPNSGCFAAGRIGKPLAEEHKETLRKISTGRVVSQETRNKISESLKGNIPWNKGIRSQ